MTPIKSMTGFGRAEKASDLGTLTIELKTVNHRYLDSRVHFPRELSMLEIPLINRIKKQLSRGKLEMTIRWQPSEALISRAQFNEALLRQYLEELGGIAENLGRNDTVSFEYLLGLPGIMQKGCETAPDEALLALGTEVLDEALGVLVEVRSREGQALAEELSSRLENMSRMRDEIHERAPEVTAIYRERLKKKADEWARAASVQVEDGRLEVEVMLFADRSDVTEELVRLSTHIQAFREMLDAPDGAPQGKPMEFLVQELLRETNTVASKSRDTSITATVLQMKSEIEKIREQVMNVE